MLKHVNSTKNNIFGTIHEINSITKKINQKMKTSNLLLIPAIAMITLAGCKSKKTPIQKETGAIEI